MVRLDMKDTLVGGMQELLRPARGGLCRASKTPQCPSVTMSQRHNRNTLFTQTLAMAGFPENRR